MASRSDIPLDVLTVTAAYRGLLEARFGDRLLMLRIFGSYARGDADGSSDIDVAVVVQDLTELERTDAIDMALTAWKVRRSTGPVSPLVWSDGELEDRVRAEQQLARAILADGVAA